MNKSLLENIILWLEPLQTHQLKKLRIIKLEAYWQVGRLLTRAKVQPQDRLRIRKIAKAISQRLPVTYEGASLRKMLRFYRAFPRWRSVCPELSWTHYLYLIRLKDRKQRQFYKRTAAKHHWNAQQLQRQIKAYYYERNLPLSKTEAALPIPQLLLKDLYILEFLNIAKQNRYLEKELEDGLIEKLQFFLMELGEGFAFVARQKRIITPTGKQFFVDLVFYHFRLRCFVLIELKVGALSHRDIGQLDMYVRLFDEKWKDEKDNPTIGIILCSEKDPSLVQYSVLQDNEQLFAAEYALSCTDKIKNDKVKAALQRMFD